MLLFPSFTLSFYRAAGLRRWFYCSKYPSKMKRAYILLLKSYHLWASFPPWRRFRRPAPCACACARVSGGNPRIARPQPHFVRRCSGQRSAAGPQAQSSQVHTADIARFAWSHLGQNIRHWRLSEVRPPFIQLSQSEKSISNLIIFYPENSITPYFLNH